MPEARDHFECRYYTVRLGGWRLGKRTFGGGRYTVGPISVNDCMALFKVIKETNATMEAHADAVKTLMQRAPWVTLKPLLPLMVRERIKPEHIKRVDALQTVAVLDAFHAANDFDYIVQKFLPSKERGGTKISLNALIHSIVTRCSAYTHAGLRRMPMQGVLAMGDCEQELQRAQEPEKSAEWTSDDTALFEGAGMTVH